MMMIYMINLVHSCGALDMYECTFLYRETVLNLDRGFIPYLCLCKLLHGQDYP